MKGPSLVGMTQLGEFCADMNPTNTRQELARKKLVYIAPDDDQQNLMERGGPAIDREMVLGYNVYGTEKLVLQPGHQITRVLSGRQQSYAAATQHEIEAGGWLCSMPWGRDWLEDTVRATAFAMGHHPRRVGLGFWSLGLRAEDLGFWILDGRFYSLS